MTQSVPARWGAVVVAAGRGMRFGSGDKLLAEMAGRAVVGWAVDALATDPRIREIVIATGRENGPEIRDALGNLSERCELRYCVGGTTRCASVGCGLAALSPDITHVAVHDGARPLVPPALVRAVLDAAERHGAAAPAIQPASTIGVRSSSGGVLAGSLDRSRLLELQTPQAATRAALNVALAKFPDETDESSALYKAGYSVVTVEGSRENIKITAPEDLSIAAALSAQRAAVA